MRKLVYFLIVLVLFPINVEAASLTCPEKVAVGSTFSCRIESNEKIGFMGKYQFDSTFRYVGIKNLSSWKIYYDGIKGLVTGKEGVGGKFVGEVQFRVEMNALVGQRYPISIVGINEVNGDYITSNEVDLISSVMVVSDVNTLSSLTVSNGSLKPKFDPNVLSYQVVVDGSYVDIAAVAADSNAVISGDIGKKQLAYGGNNFVIKVTSQMGNIREYKIYVTRKMPNKVDSTLKSLSINNKDIDLEKNKFYYEMEVSNEVVNLDIEAVANDKKAVVSIEKPDELVVGDNTVKINVVASDGTSASYVILVKRKEKLSSENRIYDLKIDGYEINFDSNKELYELEIETEDKLKISVDLVDDKASYRISGNKNLENGSKIIVEVIAEDGSKKEYVIKIKTDYDQNSSSIFDSLRVFPLIIFVFVGIILLIVRRMRKKVTENE